MNNSNISSEDVRTLQELNDEEAHKRSPTTYYLCILLVLGIIGNVLVLFVYGPQFKKNNFRTFTVCLALIDLTACCVYIPVEIVDQVRPFMFYSEAACKVCRFIGRVTTVGSALILLIIAIERHRKICLASKKQISNFLARCLCAVTLLIDVFLSWPAIFIEGLKKKTFPGNVIGYDCGTADGIRKTMYPFVYTVILLVFFSCIFLSLIVLYFFIIKTITKNSKAIRETSANRVKKTRPVTKIMLCFTIAFIVSYLPFFGLEMNSTIKRGNYGKVTPLTLAVLPLLSRSYFINNIINPIILAVGDRKFRTSCWKLLRGILCVKCVSVQPKERTTESKTPTEDTISVDYL